MKYLILLISILFTACDTSSTIPVNKLVQDTVYMSDTIYLTQIDTVYNAEVKIITETKEVEKCPSFIMTELEILQEENAVLKDSLFEVKFTLNAITKYLPTNFQVMLLGEQINK